MTYDELVAGIEALRPLDLDGPTEAVRVECDRLFQGYLASELTGQQKQHVLSMLSILAEVLDHTELLIAVFEVWWEDIENISPHPVERSNNLWSIGDAMASVGRFEEAKKAYRQVLELGAIHGALNADLEARVHARIEELLQGA